MSRETCKPEYKIGLSRREITMKEPGVAPESQQGYKMVKK
jgi:hypothetical protein